MPTKITAAQFWSFLGANLKMIPGIVSVLGLLLLLVWKLYGEDKVQAKIICEIAPVKANVSVNTRKINQMAFESKQNNLILKKIAPITVVRDVEAMTAPFKPLSNQE